jgi:hypothetical protein
MAETFTDRSAALCLTSLMRDIVDGRVWSFSQAWSSTPSGSSKAKVASPQRQLPNSCSTYVPCMRLLFPAARMQLDTRDTRSGGYDMVLTDAGKLVCGLFVGRRHRHHLRIMLALQCAIISR